VPKARAPQPEVFAQDLLQECAVIAAAVPPSARRRASIVNAASIGVATAIFIADLQTEIGVSVYVLYVPVLALAAMFSGQRFVVALAAAAVLLTIFGYLLSPGINDSWDVIASRALGISAVCTTAAILVQQKRISSDRDRAVARGAEVERESSTRRREDRARSLLLSAAEEGARARIARDIHDALGQPLTAMKLDAEWLSAHLPISDDAVRTRVSEMQDLIGSTIDTVRRLSTELRPSILDDIGLLAAIRSQVLDVAKRTGIRCHVTVPDIEPDWSSERSTTVFRILQEALTNVLRHAQASNVWVELSETSGDVVLSVTDDGRGISAGEASAADTLGLVSMRERARLHGGMVRIVGVPGQGTTVTLRLPGPRHGEVA
jgi:signal transduction histidine kinase